MLLLQGGVDMAFAANVGEMRNGTLKFYTPEAFWGCPSDYERRCDAKAAKVDAETYEAPPRLALCTRAALCGGYLCTKRPILLQLMGVQGSGKSTFCQELLRAASNNETGQIWVHLSQDTINGGKPGKREIVEKTALERLRAGNCVIIDRMHLVQNSGLTSSTSPVKLTPPVTYFGSTCQRRLLRTELDREPTT